MKRSLLATVALVVGAAILLWSSGLGNPGTPVAHSQINTATATATATAITPTPTAQANGEFAFAIDANPWNGANPCAPIDATHIVDAGADHEVAVCTVNEPVDNGGG